jgi:hypothetical protein
MGQINVYFPEDLEAEIRLRAEKQRKSLSAVIIEITKKELIPDAYPDSFWAVVGSLKNEPFAVDHFGPDELKEPDSFD